MANTAEFITLTQCTPQLTDAVKDELDRLSGELLSVNLISSDNDADLRNPHVSIAHRAADLVGLVRNKVCLDRNNYQVFIQVLMRREADHKSILKILEEKYQSLANGEFAYNKTHIILVTI